MRRVVLLAILALAFSTAALASGIDYSTGKFKSGSITGTFTTSISETEVGSLNTITIDTGTLTKLPKSDCTRGFTCYDFSGGSVTVAHGGTTVFTDSLKGGEVKVGDGLADITATLLADAKVAQGTAIANAVWRDPRAHSRSEGHHTGNDQHNRHEHGRPEEHRTLHAGSSSEVNIDPAAAAVPEPGTLGLLGSGLIGLAWMAKRKLKLPT